MDAARKTGLDKLAGSVAVAAGGGVVAGKGAVKRRALFRRGGGAQGLALLFSSNLRMAERVS